MVVISVSSCPLQLRGDLTKWLQEIDVGVYVGKLSTRVREKIWERICNNIKTGKCVMVYSSNNEQGYVIQTHNTEWQPRDYDGLSIMFKPKIDNGKNGFLKKGFSKAAKYRISSRRNILGIKNSESEREYVILDVETTGLDCNIHKIIEVGVLKIENNEIKQQYQSYVKIDEEIPQKITELTGITNETINTFGREPRQVLEELKVFIGDCVVVGYNIQFDIGFINKLCEEYAIPLFIKRSKDILKLVRKKLKLDNYQLKTVCKSYGLEMYESHQATNDCILVYKIINELNKIV